MILQGDCVEVMAGMEPESVDAIVTDPPYGLEFMGQEWDKLGAGIGPVTDWPGGGNPFGGGAKRVRYGTSAASMQSWHQAWATEALRVLKPGGYLLAFGGTRTYHRLACAIEDAGFEVRDCLSWMYASGFPKSLDVSKAIDKAAGKKRERVRGVRSGVVRGTYAQDDWSLANKDSVLDGQLLTDEAAEWQGWGTALKPAWEPIIMARKPLIGTVAANVLKYGAGAINIDGCRIGMSDRDRAKIEEGGGYLKAGYKRTRGEEFLSGSPYVASSTAPAGRWPANVVLSHTPECREVGTRKVKGAKGVRGERRGFVYYRMRGTGEAVGYTDADGTETVPAWNCPEDCPVRMLDEQSGERQSGFMRAGTEREGAGYHGGLGHQVRNDTHGDTGGASRFFFTAKASSSERSEGLGTRNSHPTVKPVSLMSWLVRMVTPPGGTVLDPFLGSGSTAVAAAGCGYNWIGIELDPEYCAIAEQRLGLFGLTA